MVEGLGVLASVLTLWEVYASTLPEAHPSDVAGSPSWILTFSIRNPSTLFDAKDAQIFCYMPSFITDVEGKTYAFGGVRIAATTRISEIEPKGVRNFSCDATRFFQEDDRAIHVLMNARTSNPELVPKDLKIRAATVNLIVTYKTLVFPRTWTSEPWNYEEAMDGSHHWSEGATIQ